MNTKPCGEDVRARMHQENPVLQIDGVPDYLGATLKTNNRESCFFQVLQR